MRHRSKTKKIGRKTAHRKAMLSNMAASLLKYKSIQTTTVKAKVLRSYVEKLITMAKKDTVAARRQVYSKLHRRDVVKILFDEVAPKFADRDGGYTRITKISFRKGDGAEISLIELLLEYEEEKAKKKDKKSPKKVKEASKKIEKVSDIKNEKTKKTNSVDEEKKEVKTEENIEESANKEIESSEDIKDSVDEKQEKIVEDNNDKTAETEEKIANDDGETLKGDA